MKRFRAAHQLHPHPHREQQPPDRAADRVAVGAVLGGEVVQPWKPGPRFPLSRFDTGPDLGGGGIQVLGRLAALLRELA